MRQSSMKPVQLKNGEKLIAAYRPAEVGLIRPVLLVLLLTFLPGYFLVKYELLYGYRFWFFLWTLALALYVLENYLVWAGQKYFFTSQRVVSIHKPSLLSREVSEVPLDKILSLSFSTSGILAYLFRYGDLEIKVAAGGQPLVLRRLRQPEKIKEVLWRLYQRQISKEANYVADPASKI